MNEAVRLPVVVLCQVFHPDTQSTSQLLSDVLARLSEIGHPLKVVSGYTGLGAENGQLPSVEVWRGIEIRRVGFRASVKKNLILRAMTYLGYTGGVNWQLLRVPRGSRILVVTNPPFLPVLVWLVCSLRGFRFKVMLQDIYPDGLIAVGRLRADGVMNRAWRALNRRAFSAASEIWVLGRDMKQLVREKYGIPRQKVRYVPHWSVVAAHTTKIPEQTELWAALELKGKFVVQYSGNMGLWHDLETIVRAAKLVEGHSAIQFLLIGQGMRKPAAEQLSRDIGATNIHWLPYQNRNDLEDSLACCHVALISQRAGLEGVAVPCKLYGILASGRAVVAQVPARSEVALVVGEENCGRVVAPGDAEALARCILELSAAREETARMGSRAHAAYLQKYTLESGARAFEKGFSDWAPMERERALRRPDA